MGKTRDEQVLPCPFCGHAGIGTNDSAYVYCFTVGCAMYAAEVTPEQWNRRASVPTTPPPSERDVYAIHLQGDRGCLFWIKPNGESWISDDVTEAARVFVEAIKPLLKATLSPATPED